MNQVSYSLPPRIRNQKNFVYNSKKYVIDFDLLKKNSNFFFNNRKSYKGIEDIPIEDENYKYSDDIIQTFTLCCQNKAFKVNEKNIFPLYRLSIIYEVEDLVSFIESYIERNKKDLVFKSILFKIQFLNSNDIKYESSNQLLDLTPNEDIISQYFIEFLDNDEFLLLPVHIIYRILQKSKINQKKLNDNDQMKIINFLCKCLDKYGKDASILFVDINFNITDFVAIELIKRLFNSYSNIINFDMINPKFLMNISSEIYYKYTESMQKKQEIHEETTPKKKLYVKKIVKIKPKITDDQQQAQLMKIKELYNQIYQQKKLIDEQKNLIDNLQGQIEKMKQIQQTDNIQNVITEDINISDEEKEAFKKEFDEQNHKINEQKHQIEEQKKEIEEQQRQMDRMKQIQQKENKMIVTKQKGEFRKLMLKRKYQKNNEHRRKELLKERDLKVTIDDIKNDYDYLINDQNENENNDNYEEEEEGENVEYDVFFEEEEEESFENDYSNLELKNIIREQKKKLKQMSKQLYQLNQDKQNK